MLPVDPPILSPPVVLLVVADCEVLLHSAVFGVMPKALCPDEVDIIAGVRLDRTKTMSPG